MRILHTALPDDWAKARADGSYDVSTRGVPLAEADFVHASTAAQLPGVLDRFYADLPAVDVLVLDVDRLEHEGAGVVWEDAADSTEGPFPHVYGVIPVVAVVDVVRVEHEPGTPWELPDPVARDVATGPPAG
jgi:glutathione S-transferase